VRVPLSLLFAVFCVACDSTPTGPTSVDQGLWGGDHVTMTVGTTGSHLEFDCAHGDIPGALSVNNGDLVANGTFVREHGGPIRVDDQTDQHPALYTGQVSSGRMKLSIRLTDSGEVVGSFDLVQGSSGRIAKCL